MLVNRSKALVSSGIETLTSSFNSTLTKLGVNISYGNLLGLIANANKLERLSKIIVTGRTKGVLALSGGLSVSDSKTFIRLVNNLKKEAVAIRLNKGEILEARQINKLKSIMMTL